MPDILNWNNIFRCSVIISILFLSTQMCGCIKYAKGTSVGFENHTKISNREIKVLRGYSITKWSSIPFYGTTTKTIASFTQAVSPKDKDKNIKFRSRLLPHFPSFGSEQWTKDIYTVRVSLNNKDGDYGINFLDSSMLKEGLLSWAIRNPSLPSILKEIPIEIRISKSFENLGAILTLGDEAISNLLVRCELRDSSNNRMLGRCLFYLYISDPSKDSVINEDSIFTTTKKMLALISEGTSVFSKNLEIEIYLDKPIEDRYIYIFPVEPIIHQDTIICNLGDEMKKNIENQLNHKKKEPPQ